MAELSEDERALIGNAQHIGQEAGAMVECIITSIASPAERAKAIDQMFENDPNTRKRIYALACQEGVPLA